MRHTHHRCNSMCKAPLPGLNFSPPFLRIRTMKSSMTALVAVFTIGSVGLVASSALAWHGGGFGGGYGGYSSNYSPSTEYVRDVNFQAPTFAPGHSIIIVLPGDSWAS